MGERLLCDNITLTWGIRVSFVNVLLWYFIQVLLHDPKKCKRWIVNFWFYNKAGILYSGYTIHECGKTVVCNVISLAKIWTNIVAAFQGMHVSHAKHSYAWLPRKCDFRTDTHIDRHGTKWSLCAAMLCRRHKTCSLSFQLHNRVALNYSKKWKFNQTSERWYTR